MKIYRLPELLPLLDKAAVIDAVKAAFIAHAKSEVQSPMPGSLVFPEANGDCHIKYGQMDGSSHFAIKVATGFYDNPKRNLPANNGLVMVFDAQTGIPQSLFLDEGWLTAWRTAAATALATEILSPRPDPKIGIMGTGLQAQLATEWIPALLPKARFAMLGRNAESARKTAEKLGIEAAANSAGLLATCDIIITATPSAHELFSADLVRPGMHFVGIGADGPEKAELPTGLFAQAARILVDCPKQCLTLSDFGRSCREGQATPDRANSLGDALAGPKPVRAADDITIADLTGIAAQDIAIANLFADKLR